MLFARVFTAVMCFGSLSSFGANLTVCGNADGGPGDSDGVANGSVTTTCGFPLGLFTGTVTEFSADPIYGILVSGTLTGSAERVPLATAAFSSEGDGNLYSYTFYGARLESTLSGATANGNEFLAILATASNHITSSPYRGPLPPPIPAGRQLPTFTGSGIGTLEPGVFTGPGILSVFLTYETGGPDRRFLFLSDELRVETRSPNIPEPSTLLPVGIGLLGLLLFRSPGLTARVFRFLSSRRRP